MISTVDKALFTAGQKKYAVAQFTVYVSLFALWAVSNDDINTNFGSFFLSLIAVMVAALISYSPVYAAQQNDRIKYGRIWNYAYFTPVGVLFFYSIFYLFTSFYQNNFSMDEARFYTFCVFYLIVSPMLSFFLTHYAKTM